MVSFFFYCYVDHRDLHSFPTRRSSDLVIRPASPTRESISSARERAGRCSIPPINRSEEHTSELQSHSDLVCRLLLEKKKKKKKNNTKKKNKTTNMKRHTEITDT